MAGEVIKEQVNDEKEEEGEEGKEGEEEEEREEESGEEEEQGLDLGDGTYDAAINVLDQEGTLLKKIRIQVVLTSEAITEIIEKVETSGLDKLTEDVIE